MSRIILAILLSVLNFSSWANLIERDRIYGSGDGLITFDTDTGLEWLDVPESADYSYDDIVANELGSGGVFEGFRHASREDVRTLFNNAGIDDINESRSYTYYDEILSLADLLGGTTGDGGVTGGAALWGISETPATANSNWAPFLYWTENIDLLPSGFEPLGAQATTAGTLPTFAAYTNEAGNWLVRPASVPEPTTVALLGLSIVGLLGLGFVRKKRMNNNKNKKSE